jgi:hypothetical protein
MRSGVREVDPDEDDHLIGLVETLLREWYVAREERRARMEAVMVAAAAKKALPTSQV